MKKLLWLGCLSYLTIGIAHIVGGALLEQLIEHYGITYKDGGQWIMNQFLGFLVGVLLAPSLTSRFGKRTTVLIAFGALTLGEAAYSLLLPWGFMLAIAPMAGFGFGMIEAVVGAMIIDSVKNGKASAMSRLETFFGVGALAIPIAVAFLIQQHVWQLSFPILAALSGITFVLWFTMSFGDMDEKLGPVPKEQRDEAHAAVKRTPLEAKGKLFGYELSAIPFLLFAALFFMVYVGMEMSFSNYLPSFLILREGMPEAGAAAALSLFWGMMVVGRLFAGAIADRVGYVRYLGIAVVGASAVFVLFALMNGLSWMLACIVLSGLLFSGVFGIALVYANEMLPGMTERTTSILVACGGLGGALFPKATGWFLDNYSIGTTLWFISVLVGVMLLLLVGMFVINKRRMNQASAQ